MLCGTIPLTVFRMETVPGLRLARWERRIVFLLKTMLLERTTPTLPVRSTIWEAADWLCATTPSLIATRLPTAPRQLAEKGPCGTWRFTTTPMQPTGRTARRLASTAVGPGSYLATHTSGLIPA